ncbi:hypothetical protein TWF730_000165 [Orbilia blumenaviensis]|uniref:Histidine decarboxylase n=1 Tax=Orbilia blumenaviensis TaxID=1796055 RepID=A0AAV9VKQ2_9PEZI
MATLGEPPVEATVLPKDFSIAGLNGQQELIVPKGLAENINYNGFADRNPAITISVTELPSPTPGSPYDTPIPSPRLTPSKITLEDPSDLQSIFKRSQSQWIDDPIITSWRNPTHKIHNFLTSTNHLLKAWSSTPPHTPFSPYSDPLWLETGDVLKRAGLPWHNNQVGMPNDLDSSWPFHFKSYEMEMLRIKGSRVGDSDADGYISHSSEANCYCLRALQRELRKLHPQARPLVVYDCFDKGVLYSIQTFLGLQSYQVDLSSCMEDIIEDLKNMTDGLQRPVIFAANLATADGKYDDINAICNISKHIPMLLHLDMTRNFEYITTLPENDRKILGISNLKLGVKPLSQPLRLPDGSIIACTIVAGGAHHTDSPLAVALKPTSLGGSTESVRISYVRCRDETLAGSRDAIGPLWFSLQEARFGEEGFRQVYRRCREMKDMLENTLQTCGVSITTSPYSLDIILRGCSEKQVIELVSLGAISTETGILITIQPSVTSEHINRIIEILSISPPLNLFRTENIHPTPPDFSVLYQVSQSIVTDITSTVERWKSLTQLSSGYPLYMGSLSVLGPIIGQFLNINIPKNWLKLQRKTLLTSRMQSFGLHTSKDRANFNAAFTNGSTMGNRIGLHAAFKRLPNATIYFSTETHYSVIKTMRDCDTITERWGLGRPRFHQIPCNEDGSISVNLLVQRAMADKREALECGEEYRMILLANIGTTFVGARDNLKEIYGKLKSHGIQISHIHADGAFDLGYSTCGIKLGLPGKVGPDGVPMVQGITISNHKAMGSMVSGEVISYSPGNELAALEWTVDPRIIFERWLYSQAYTPADCKTLLRYCQDNASHLETSLRKIGVVTKRNPGAMIVVLEKPPAWIIEEFSLRPEGDWVHFITVPDISPQTIDLFVSRIQDFKNNCLAALNHINPYINRIMSRPIEMRCIQSRDPLAKQIAELTRGAAASLDGGDNDNLAPTTVMACMRSGLSVAILDASRKELKVVLLMESFRDRTMRAGAVLIRSRYATDADTVMTVARLLPGLMARQMGIELTIDQMSYSCFLV